MDKILRAYTRLVALKENLLSRHDIHEKYIKDYHEIVDVLSSEAHTSLGEFRIPAHEIKPILTGGNYLTGEKFYSKDNYCERTLFLSKLDALLSYFQIKYLSKEKQEIGFKSSKK